MTIPASSESYKQLFASAKVKELRGHTGKVHSVAWSHDGKLLASGAVDKTARIWHVERASKDLELRGHTDSVDQLCWDPLHPHVLATASADKTVRIWDANVGKNTSCISTGGENINITWAPDGHTLAVGSKEDDVYFIDMRTLKVISKKSFEFEVNEITWTPDGRSFLVTSGIGSIIVLEYPSLRVAQSLAAHTANCLCLKVDPSGRYFATGSADSIVSLWDLQEKICLRTFSKLEWPVRSLAFSHDGQLIAYASEDRFIDFGMVETGESVFQLSVPAAINSVAWHPQRLLLAYGGEDKDKYGKDDGVIRIFGS